MATYFISDLHLDESQPQLTELFKQALTQLHDCEALYILGDLFEVWIGDDENSAYQQHIAQLLKAASQRYPIYFLAGNRDFLLGKRYLAQSGMIGLNDPSVVVIYGRQILLTHGDSLCTTDKAHQRFRRFVHVPGFKSLFTCLPLLWRKNLASKIRRKSQQRNRQLSLASMDTHPPAIQQLLTKHKVQQLIHGHTHQPSICLHYKEDQAEPSRVVVLSDWHQLGNMLMYQPDHQIALKYFA